MSTDEPKRATYHDLLEPFPHPEDSQPLANLYFAARYAPPLKAVEIITEIYEALSHRIDAYWGPPDIWHNFAIHAGRQHLDDAEYQFYISGLSAWPDDVDLLCDLLQEYTGVGNQHYSRKLAGKTWEILEGLPRNATGPYWRFWVFSAIYFARIVGDSKRGIQQLDEGLLHVRRDSLMDILRSYRTLLVDQAPGSPINHVGDLDAAQQGIIEKLEHRYMLGIRLGVENGYVLATDLARLYQERAGTHAVESVLRDPRSVQEDVNADLDKALTYLKLAESLYTGDPRHPVDEIYKIRVRVLMAQGHYGEVLRILQSMSEVTKSDSSMKTMLHLAMLATGGKLDEEPEAKAASSSADSSSAKVFERIFDGQGETLATLVQQNAQARLTFYRALRLLQKGDEEDGK